jgi:hypothetical protein
MRRVLGTITVLLGLAAAMSMAEAGQGGHRYHRYGNHGHTRDDDYGWRGLRLFGFGYDGGRCDQFLRQAIQIDTPDPRYWNRYDACIGL